MEDWDEINKHRILPGGCVTVKDAFNTLGKFVLDRPGVAESNRWTGLEAGYRDLGPRPARPGDVYHVDTSIIANRKLYRKDAGRVASWLGVDLKTDPQGLSYERWSRALDIWQSWETSRAGISRRRMNTFALMKRTAAVGDLTFVTFEETTGAISSISPNAWNCTTHLANHRFTLAAVNSDPRWFLKHPERDEDYPSYLSGFDIPMFVAGASLRALLPKLEGEVRLAVTAGSPRNSDDLSDIILKEFQDRTAGESSAVSLDEKPPAEAPQSKLKPVSSVKLKHWAKRRNQQGATQLDLIRERGAAFPNNSRPSRDAVIAVDAEAREALGLPPRTVGSPKKA